jgi:hypothetical protein
MLTSSIAKPPKFTQFGIFGLKICHLATPVGSCILSRVTRLDEFFPIGSLFTLGIFLSYRRGSPNFRTTFFHSKSCVTIWQLNELGNILGDFYTTSSGHPDSVTEEFSGNATVSEQDSFLRHLAFIFIFFKTFVIFAFVYLIRVFISWLGVPQCQFNIYHVWDRDGIKSSANHIHSTYE